MFISHFCMIIILNIIKYINIIYIYIIPNYLVKDLLNIDLGLELFNVYMFIIFFHDKASSCTNN